MHQSIAFWMTFPRDLVGHGRLVPVGSIDLATMLAPIPCQAINLLDDNAPPVSRIWNKAVRVPPGGFIFATSFFRPIGLLESLLASSPCHARGSPRRFQLRGLDRRWRPRLNYS